MSELNSMRPQCAGCETVGRNQTDTEDDTYRLRPVLPRCSLSDDRKKKTTAWWRSESCPHNFSLTSTNRYTTCGDSIRKPLAADRLWANCCLGGIQKWEGSVYKDKNTPWNPSTCDVLYKDRQLSYIALRRWHKDFWKCSKLRVHLNQSI